MSRRRLQVVLLLSFCFPIVVAAPAGPSDLTFEQRVAAQRAIEQVYYAHQTEARLTFDEAVPLEVLERKVRDSLRQSAALEKQWGQPITAAMLRAEAQRMATDTRMPDRLEEIHSALGHDPVLILECLVRPALAGRLVRARFDADPALQGEALEAPLRIQSWDDWWSESGSTFDDVPVATVATASDSVPEPALSRSPEGTPLTGCGTPADMWDTGGALAPQESRTLHTAVWTGSRMLVWGGFSGSTYSSSGIQYDPVTDTSTPISQLNVPSPRVGHTAVWTGTRMIVWGGSGGGTPLSTGGSYDPVADTWSALTLTSAPQGRISHSAVWTGSAMVIWGGNGSPGNPPIALNTGARYAPGADKWTSMTLSQAPTARLNHSAIWTGTRMIVWGGGDGTGSGQVSTGGSYNPVNDSWTALSANGAPAARELHTAAWTGNRMIIWGGPSPGALYDPAADTWISMTSTGAPSNGAGHTAVWTGSRMIVWGGRGGGLLGTGGSYDPSSDSWSSVSIADAPSPRDLHTSVWTGDRMIVYGGSNNGGSLYGRYNPATDTWESSTYRPQNNSGRAIWTGAVMVTGEGLTHSNDPGFPSFDRYDPALDLWSRASNVNAPSTSTCAGCGPPVWTGQRVIMNRGSYDPIADTWTAISGAGAPSGASIAVWTGSRMILWGPSGGGLYDPVADGWTTMSTVGAPPTGFGYTGVWSGSRLIVWGSSGTITITNAGGRYDPVTNTWSSMSGANVPTPTATFKSVWAGGRMVVWGGYYRTCANPPTCSSYRHNYLQSGGIYDPAADQWSAFSGSVWGRTNMSAISTGDEAIFWGGYACVFNQSQPDWCLKAYLQDGFRYNVTTGTYAPLSNLNAPSPRERPAAAWTGSEMIVYGGVNATTFFMLDGGRYLASIPGLDGDADGFAGTCDCDDGRASVHPGAPQICGDGLNNDCSHPAWPSLTGTNEVDDDGDGLAECSGDCDDAHATVRPGAPQICDGLNNDCNAPDWPAIPSTDDDQDADGYRVCSGDCDDTRAGVWPGAPQICDGLNNDCSAPGWPAPPSNELDNDGDSFMLCSGDCDDTRGTVAPGAPQICGDSLNNDCSHPGWPSLTGTTEGDDDGDGLSECGGDCDDSHANVRPGGPQICDGLNNDCTAPGWPATPPNEFDDDGDLLSECTGDCDDGSAATYPGAFEVNDGRDNQCPGDPGYGSIDEMTDLEFPDPSLNGRLCWAAQEGATSYRLARAGDRFMMVGLLCEAPMFDLCDDDLSTPAVGAAFFYLVRAESPFAGSWGRSSAGGETVVTCGAPP